MKDMVIEKTIHTCTPKENVFFFCLIVWLNIDMATQYVREKQ